MLRTESVPKSIPTTQALLLMMLSGSLLARGALSCHANVRERLLFTHRSESGRARSSSATNLSRRSPFRRYLSASPPLVSPSDASSDDRCGPRLLGSGGGGGGASSGTPPPSKIATRAVKANDWSTALLAMYVSPACEFNPNQ